MFTFPLCHFASQVEAGFNPRSHYKQIAYTGDGTAIGSGGLAVTGAGFQPDMVWIKGRNVDNREWEIYDAVRGVHKNLTWSDTETEETDTEGLDSYDSDGFTVGNLANQNESSTTYLAHCFSLNGAGSSNTDGTITATTSGNSEIGVSVSIYTANATGGATVGHDCGATPEVIILKERTDDGGQTYVWHTGMGNADYYANLADDSAVATAATNRWHGGAHTSTVFEIGNHSDVNGSGDTYVAWCFAPVSGFSKFGTYTGNGSSTGPTVSSLGFTPTMTIIKSAATGSWIMHSATLDGTNPRSTCLEVDLETTEITSGYDIDYNADSFQIKSTNGDLNTNSQSYMYMAFA